MKAAIFIVAVLACLPPTCTASVPCAEAQRLLAAAETGSADVTASSLMDALRACPATSAFVRSGPTGDALTMLIGDLVPLMQLPASQCGFVDKAVANNSSAPIEVNWQASFVGPTTSNDQGPAVASFTPTTRVTTFAVQGATYGMTAQSNGVGSITILGVTLPATQATAASGCKDTNRSLCWASGIAQIQLEGETTIEAQSWFDQC